MGLNLLSGKNLTSTLSVMNISHLETKQSELCFSSIFLADQVEFDVRCMGADGRMWLIKITTEYKTVVNRTIESNVVIPL